MILRDVTARRGSEALPSMESLDVKDFQKRNKKLVNRAIDRVFAGRPLSSLGKKRLREYAALVIVKSRMSSLGSGVVIAGFGEEELFPRMVCITTDGIVGGIHRIRRDDHVIIAPDNAAYIQAFAQREMVKRFMEGVDPKYQDYIDTGITEVLQDIVGKVIGELVPAGSAREKALAAASRVAAKSVGEFLDRADQYRYDYFSWPIVQTVAMLPKEELGNLAESLVNLTSIKRRMSMDAETVGGPIDVAIISKGDEIGRAHV